MWVALSVVAFAMLLLFVLTRPRPRKEPLRVERVEPGGDELVVTMSDGARYRGSCTVWHAYPDGKRCTTEMELLLSDVWKREQWRDEMNKARIP
jgi:hypothetical protein